MEGHSRNLLSQFREMLFQHKDLGILVLKENQLHKGKTRKVIYNPNESCTYCLKTGHVEDDCYRLIG
ncbi:hypothetical protein KY290_025309 [Solanum tuberosum]|uniref:Uncharacterized protein n=1 Tax=Solanum tuberosum TaxID=4113 RepID=A0ABQ7UT65_SOLTU|nr:hypothetical protein KY290_025309 [Solanum tuberosum]